jgi:hypothetical protein
MTKFFILIVFLKITFFACGQDCKELLRNSFHWQNAIQAPTKGVVYYLDMTYTFNFWGKSQNQTIINTKICLADNFYLLESEMHLVYSDNENFFLVDLNNRTIIKRPSVKDVKPQEGFEEQILGLQQNLIERGRMTSCLDTLINEEQQRFISIIPENEVTDNMMVSKVSYFISSSNTPVLKKVIILYKPTHNVKTLVASYNSINLNYQDLKSDKAIDYIYDSNGKLKSRFRNYRIVEDN